MLSMQSLKEYGVKTDMGLQRCCGMQDFYFDLITRSVDDKNFDALGDALAAKDYTAAFEAAHALKGVLGNLALDPLYDAVCAIVEPLRMQDQKTNYSALYDVIKKQRVRLAELLAKN